VDTDIQHTDTADQITVNFIASDVFLWEMMLKVTNNILFKKTI